MKFNILILLLVTQLFSQSVDFMYGNFKEIIRFDKIQFEGGKPSDVDVSKVISSIHDNINEGKNIYISVIGHSSKNSDVNQSLKYASSIKNLFIKNNISEDIIFEEGHESKEPLYVGNDELSNRVMVSLYVHDQCKSKGMIVLVHNDKDKNSIRFSNDVGYQDINTVNKYIVMCSKVKKLSKPKSISEDDLKKMFPYLSSQKKPISCKGKVIVVLINNDENENENAVVVKTNAGEQIIERTNEYVKICSKDKAPSIPEEYTDNNISTMFPYVSTATRVRTISKNALYFENGNNLDSKSVQRLEEILEEHKNESNLEITIKGYTDTLATSSFNKKLSQQRVDTVEKYVRNIRKDIIVKKEIYGEENLAVPTADNTFEPLNRRVEIEIR